MPVTGEHAEHAAKLPRYRADPFDRVLVARPLSKRLVFGTRDAKIRAHGVPTLGLAAN